MHLLISGICGFVGSTLAREFLRLGFDVSGFDNFSRPGSQTNREPLIRLGAKIFQADAANTDDMAALPGADWVLDAAANASVLAGLDDSSRRLVSDNLIGTINLLEYCKRRRAGFTLLSSSRVYSIPPLASLPVDVADNAFIPNASRPLPPGLTPEGVGETFPTATPISLYGATKLASETLALEYGETFGFPVFVNRCGVLAGAGQFGRPDQGIFAYWINSHLRRKPLRYIGFDGQGHQVRDCLHPRDLVPLMRKQFANSDKLPPSDRVLNVSGGASSAMSLRQLTAWCDARFGPHAVASDPRPRPFDIPWMVLNSAKAKHLYDWQPATPLEAILDEIANHAESHPDWLTLSTPA
ncbi:MAG: NAD-dependent epimerase/dehydratase family protein [Opitutaceae bacterium]|jgi:CDP-paratose 2-epimerase|nr:NAD-dependent epimerase/dehydratase family protein [Opitutaceae bacterium]